MRFYVRHGCHLCDDARPLVVRAAAVAGFGVDEVDVDADPATAVDYGLRIPVVEGPDGRVLAEGVIEWRPLLREMRRERR
ncbi:MAG: glutaredoxin family protein [Acidimicrobiia bacterium]